MSFTLGRILRYGHLRQTRLSDSVGAIRSISLTARLKDAPVLPNVKPRIDILASGGNVSDQHELFKPRNRPRLIRPILFTLGVGLCSFSGAAYLSRLGSQALAQTATTAPASAGNLRHEPAMRELQHANATYAWLRDMGCPGFILKSYAWLGDYWLNTNDGERVALGLVAANTIVFLAWRIPLPAVRFFMVKHFMHHPLSGRSYTLLTSAFSHVNPFHFTINMVALQSFVRESSFYIGSAESLDPNFRGITPPYMFTLIDPNSTYTVLAFFLTSGVFSMFGSHASHAIRLLRLKRQTTDLKALSNARQAMRPTLGASGAVYSTLVVTALAVPDAEVQLLFLPFLTVPIRWGAAGLVAMDMTGIVRGWRVLDHYGHLSGAVFGGAYFFAGPYLWPGLGGASFLENTPSKT